jgi:GAF domain-containing protein
MQVSQRTEQDEQSGALRTRVRPPAQASADHVVALLDMVREAEASLADVLRHLAERSEGELHGPDGVVVAVRRPEGGREVVATDPAAQQADQLQLGLREGPVLDALAEGRAVESDDLTDDSRWPRLAGALGTSGVRSVVCQPITIEGAVLGTLSVYAGRAGAFDQDTAEVVAGLAASAALGVRTALVLERVRSLTVQLHLQGTDRELVDEAVAVLVEENAVSSEEALAVLQMLRHTEHQDLTDVARAVVRDRVSD